MSPDKVYEKLRKKYTLKEIAEAYVFPGTDDPDPAFAEFMEARRDFSLHNRREIYLKAMEQIDGTDDYYYCCSIVWELCPDKWQGRYNDTELVKLYFPELMLFSPGGWTPKSGWWMDDEMHERRMALQICAELCAEDIEKMELITVEMLRTFDKITSKIK